MFVSMGNTNDQIQGTIGLCCFHITESEVTGRKEWTCVQAMPLQTSYTPQMYLRYCGHISVLKMNKMVAEITEKSLISITLSQTM